MRRDTSSFSSTSLGSDKSLLELFTFFGASQEKQTYLAWLLSLSGIGDLEQTSPDLEPSPLTLEPPAVPSN